MLNEVPSSNSQVIQGTRRAHTKQMRLYATCQYAIYICVFLLKRPARRHAGWAVRQFDSPEFTGAGHRLSEGTPFHRNVESQETAVPFSVALAGHSRLHAKDKQVEPAHCSTGATSEGTGGEEKRLWAYHQPLCFMRERISF